MLETWKDTWFEEGLRAFYIVPRQTTDQLLPLTITPAPKATVKLSAPTAHKALPKREAAARVAAPKPKAVAQAGAEDHWKEF